MNEGSRIERLAKPKKCPACGHAPVAVIQYGYPIYSERLQQQLSTGEIVLGGCCVGFDMPRWQCTQCGQQIFRKARHEPRIG